jgi:hypothetical protein
MQMYGSAQELCMLPLRGDWRLRSGEGGGNSASNTWRQQVSLRPSSVFRGADPSCSSNARGEVAKVIDVRSDAFRCKEGASLSSTAQDGMRLCQKIRASLAQRYAHSTAVRWTMLRQLVRRCEDGEAPGCATQQGSHVNAID